MRFSLNTLLVLIAIGPPALAHLWWGSELGWNLHSASEACGIISYALAVMLLASAYISKRPKSWKKPPENSRLVSGATLASFVAAGSCVLFFLSHPSLDEISKLNQIPALARKRARIQPRSPTTKPANPQLTSIGPGTSAYASVLHRRGLTHLWRQEFAEAESLFRQCVMIRDRIMPGSLLAFSARSYLSDSLVNLKRYSEAEPLLLSVQQELSERQAEIDADQVQLSQVRKRLALLYEAWDKPEVAEKWRDETEPAIVEMKLPALPVNALEERFSPFPGPLTGSARPSSHQ